MAWEFEEEATPHALRRNQGGSSAHEPWRIQKRTDSSESVLKVERDTRFELATFTLAR